MVDFRMYKKPGNREISDKTWKTTVDIKSRRNEMYNTNPVFTYSKLIIETLEQGVKYVQS